jgi:hypothetical protein
VFTEPLSNGYQATRPEGSPASIASMVSPRAASSSPVTAPSLVANGSKLMRPHAESSIAATTSAFTHSIIRPIAN